MTTQDGAAPTESSIDSQLGWSTSSFRAWPLSGALAEIGGQGFGGIDLGALPVVCDHVPPPLPCDLVDVLTDQTVTSGSAVRLIDAHLAGTQPGRVAAEIPPATDPGRPGEAVGTSTIMLARRRQGTELRTGPSRAIATVVRPLTAAEFVGRSGNHIEHVPIPDAVPGEADLGNRQVDFARGLKAPADAGFAGHHCQAGNPLHHQRPAATARAARLTPDSPRHHK